MIKSVFRAVQKGVESNKQNFLKLKDIDNHDVLTKWSQCLNLVQPLQTKALAENNISHQDFNKLYNREFRKYFLDTYSKVIDYSFGYTDIKLLSNEAVKLVSVLYLRDLASKEVKDFVKGLLAQDISPQDKKAAFQKQMVEIQIAELRHCKRSGPQGWLELMLSFQLFSITNQKYVEKLMKKQDEQFERLQSDLI